MRSTTPRGSSSNLLSLGWFPPTKWRFLRHLSLADNALTNITSTSLAPLANTLQSLDLSANLFTEIPDSLATLSCLRALNLSNCMIESLHSLGRNPLPAITTLNLRSNRLTSLAGIERLLSLERVDFRDNKLTDPTEVARLTGVPYITEIYVHRNPFCKSYSNYRTTIFNLFRKTPGYTDDILIDSTGPSNSERKQLVDRVPEPPSVPVVKPPPEDEPPLPPPRVIQAQDIVAEPADNARRASLHRSKSGKSGQAGSHRKKKVTKRRIVELTRSEAISQTPDSNLESLSSPPEYTLTEAPITAKAKQTAPQPEAPHPAIATPRFEEPREDVSGDPAKKPQPPPIDTVLKTQPVPEFDVSSDLYKKKIEALRQDFGNNWLSALGDEGWDARSVTGFPSDVGYTSPALRPTLPRTPSQGIVSGGRTLG